MPIIKMAPLIFLALAPLAQAQVPIDFTFAPGSGLSGNLSMEADTSGTLVGNWDPKANPTGTRTKPGLFGTFGPTENVPVPVNLGAQVGGNLSTQTAGVFRLTLDTSKGTILAENYAADFLASGPLSLPATLSLLFNSFRTRSPTSTYIGGIPLNLPIGEVELSAMSAVQKMPSALGTLTATGPSTYDFAVLIPVELTASLTVLGNLLEVPPTPLVLALEGQIMLSGSTASLMSVVPLVFNNTSAPGATIPQFPLDLPTILPPGETAHLLMDLVLDEVSATLNANLTTQAQGVVIPTPAAWALGILGGVVVLGRRRR